jgi:hypothetical protein
MEHSAVIEDQNRFPSLLALRRALSEEIVPASPEPEFRARLHSYLVQSALQQHVQRNLAIASGGASETALEAPGMPTRVAHWLISDGQGGWRWVFGAAAVGSAVSLAGALALLLRYRGRRVA